MRKERNAIEVRVDELTVEIEDQLLEQFRAVLKPRGLTVEDALRQFLCWCADDPELAGKTLLLWQEEQAKQAEHNDEGGN